LQAQAHEVALARSVGDVGEGDSPVQHRVVVYELNVARAQFHFVNQFRVVHYPVDAGERRELLGWRFNARGVDRLSVCCRAGPSSSAQRSTGMPCSTKKHAQPARRVPPAPAATLAPATENHRVMLISLQPGLRMPFKAD
jgi:hypothetical protein